MTIHVSLCGFVYELRHEPCLNLCLALASRCSLYFFDLASKFLNFDLTVTLLLQVRILVLLSLEFRLCDLLLKFIDLDVVLLL